MTHPEHNPEAEAYVAEQSKEPAKLADILTERNRWIACCVACTVLGLGAGWWTGHIEATPRTPYEAQVIADAMLATENKEHAVKVHGPNAHVTPEGVK